MKVEKEKGRRIKKGKRRKRERREETAGLPSFSFLSLYLFFFLPFLPFSPLQFQLMAVGSVHIWCKVVVTRGLGEIDEILHLRAKSVQDNAGCPAQVWRDEVVPLLSKRCLEWNKRRAFPRRDNESAQVVIYAGNKDEREESENQNEKEWRERRDWRRRGRREDDKEACVCAYTFSFHFFLFLSLSLSLLFFSFDLPEHHHHHHHITSNSSYQARGSRVSDRAATFPAVCERTLEEGHRPPPLLRRGK